MGFLTNKTAIITGAGRAVLSDGRCGSIGYGIATAYAKEGANLVITGRNVQKLTDAKEELERLYGIRVLPGQAEVHAGADTRTSRRRARVNSDYLMFHRKHPPCRLNINAQPRICAQ